QMLRIRWGAWKALTKADKDSVAAEASTILQKLEPHTPGQSALFSLLGHKGDVMLVHFRNTLDELNRIEFELAQLKLWDFMEPTSSYVSVVELGLYESTVKTY